MEDLLNDIMLRFFRDDIGGILITDENGAVIYEDDKSSAIRNSHTNWSAACPTPSSSQKAELWELADKDSQKTYLVATSTVIAEGKTLQIHQITDSGAYSELFREINGYSKALIYEKEHDKLTGLYNKGKFISLQNTLFLGQDRIAIFFMDVNNLKYANDVFGHEEGDRMICKAANSLKKVSASNVMSFRMGGDEFALVMLCPSAEETELLRRDWEAALSEINEAEGGMKCVVSCGVAFAQRPYDLEKLMQDADQRMYEDKKEKKRLAALRGEPVSRK